MELSTAGLHPSWAFACRSPPRSRSGWLMSRARSAEDRAGKGLDALPMFLCR